MAIVKGIVGPNGNIVRSSGRFRVLSTSKDTPRIQVIDQRTAKAFVLATLWRNDGDIGSSGVSASPDPQNADVMIFAVPYYHGLSFRIEP